MVNDRDEVHCFLVMAKSRVTLLKPVTVPRLELTAAVVTTRISDFLQKELRYDFFFREYIFISCHNSKTIHYLQFKHYLQSGRKLTLLLLQ